jgi:CBS domain containing-hemolysin-like protein
MVLQGGQSRVPVYDDTIDNIIGVLYAKDLLRVYASGQKPATVRHLVRPAYFVPESKRLDDLLRELQQQRVHMAIVVDEYGSVTGLVTIEDLVEEVVGDIKDEYDVEEQLYERVGENEFTIDAKIDLDEFNELVDRELPEDGYDTVGGFVYSQLDKIPTVGDTVRFQDMEFTVLATKGRRVTKIKVVRGLPPVETEAERGEEATASEREAQAEPASESSTPQSNAQPAQNTL